MWIKNTLSIILGFVVIQCASVDSQITIYVNGPTKIIQDCPEASASVMPLEEEYNRSSTEHPYSNVQNTAGSCPESEGFIKSSNSQCFRFFSGDVKWETAKEKCESEGMVLAKPEDEIVGELRQALRDIICPDGYNCEDVWLGARGSDGKMVWDRDGSEISNDSPLWAKYEPDADMIEYAKYGMSDGWCLILEVGRVGEEYYMSQPYESTRCQHQFAHYPTLCEVISA